MIKQTTQQQDILECLAREHEDFKAMYDLVEEYLDREIQSAAQVCCFFHCVKAAQENEHRIKEQFAYSDIEKVADNIYLGIKTTRGEK